MIVDGFDFRNHAVDGVFLKSQVGIDSKLVSEIGLIDDFKNALGEIGGGIPNDQSVVSRDDGVIGSAAFDDDAWELIGHGFLDDKTLGFGLGSKHKEVGGGIEFWEFLSVNESPESDLVADFESAGEESEVLAGGAISGDPEAKIWVGRHRSGDGVKEDIEIFFAGESSAVEGNGSGWVGAEFGVGLRPIDPKWGWYSGWDDRNLGSNSVLF